MGVIFEDVIARALPEAIQYDYHFLSSTCSLFFWIASPPARNDERQWLAMTNGVIFEDVIARALPEAIQDDYHSSVSSRCILSGLLRLRLAMTETSGYCIDGIHRFTTECFLYAVLILISQHIVSCTDAAGLICINTALMFYSFGPYIPVVHPSAFVHPQAVVTGNVIIGKDVYIGPGAALRGDWGKIVIEDGCNVQENCTLHMFPGLSVILRENAHIGHGAVIHGAEIGFGCLVGMNAVIMDEVILGAESIVGALTFIKAGEKFPDRSLIVGNPGKRIKTVSDEMIKWKSAGTALYQQLPQEMRTKSAPVEPLQEEPQSLPEQAKKYDPWLFGKKI